MIVLLKQSIKCIFRPLGIISFHIKEYDMSNIVDFYTPNSFSVIYLEILTPRILIGDNLEFTFTLENISEHSQLADIWYEITYHSADGTAYNKRYPISSRKCPKGFLLFHRELEMAPQEFPLIAPGTQELTIIVNQSRLKSTTFWVTDLREGSSQNHPLY